MTNIIDRLGIWTLEDRTFVDAVKAAKPRFSVCGGRYVDVPGYEGLLPIDAFAGRVIELIQKKGFAYSEEERSNGQALAEAICKLYQKSDEALQRYVEWHCWGSPLYKTRDLFNRVKIGSGYTTREVWQDRDDGFEYCKLFSYYTRDQFIEKFHQEPSMMTATQGFPKQTSPLWLSR